MKRTHLVPAILVALFAGGTSLFAQEANNQPPPASKSTGQPSRQLQNLSHELAARLKELHDKRGSGGTNWLDRDRLLEELKHLPPEEREARLKELREKRGHRQPGAKLTPEERETKRRELRARFDTQLAELRKKKADDTISDEEARRLRRMEELAARLQRRGSRPDAAPAFSEKPAEAPALPQANK